MRSNDGSKNRERRVGSKKSRDESIVDGQKAFRRARKLLLLGSSSLATLLLTYAAHAQSPTPVPGVDVTAPQSSNDGSAAAGYRVDNQTASGNFWGDLAIQDTPYSVSVVPQELIENLNAYTMDDLYRVMPQVSNSLPTGNDSNLSYVTIRGFTLSTSNIGAGTGFAVDGLMGGVGGSAIALEDKESVQLLAGTSGFLYGVGAVGGIINSVWKRPTAQDYSKVTVSYYDGANFGVHGDFGGPLKLSWLPDGLMGYRINLAGQDGNNETQNQVVRHTLMSAAFDFHLPNNILFQVNASHSTQFSVNDQGFYFTGLSTVPTAPYNPPAIPWQWCSQYQDTGAGKVTWKINDIFTVRSEYAYTRNQTFIVPYDDPYILNQSGTLLHTSPSYENDSANINHVSSGYAFLDATFDTFGLHNKVTTGFTGYQVNEQGGATAEAPVPQSYTTNLYAQGTPPQPTWIYTPSGRDYMYYHQFATNYMLGDEITWNKFILMAGGNFTAEGYESYSMTGPTGGYSTPALTPTASLVYKALPWLSLYGTYQESLQEGTLVPIGTSPTYTNAGAVLPPYRAKQVEGGVKATVGKNLLVTAAIYSIDEANIYTEVNPNQTRTEFEGGSDIHKGIELTASGKVTDNWTVIAGLNLIDARIADNPVTPSQDGQLASGVSPVSGKIYSEYTLPFMPDLPWLRGLTLTGGLQYIGKFWGDNGSYTYANELSYPAVVLGEVGFRYNTQFYDHPVTVRVDVTNVTGQAFWQATDLQGNPRVITAALDYKW